MGWKKTSHPSSLQTDHAHMSKHLSERYLPVRTLCRRFREARELSGLLQAKAADLLGVNAERSRRIEQPMGRLHSPDFSGELVPIQSVSTKKSIGISRLKFQPSSAKQWARKNLWKSNGANLRPYKISHLQSYCRNSANLPELNKINNLTPLAEVPIPGAEHWILISPIGGSETTPHPAMQDGR